MPWYCFKCTECERTWEQNQVHTNEYCVCQAFAVRDYRAEAANINRESIRAVPREGAR